MKKKNKKAIVKSRENRQFDRLSGIIRGGGGGTKKFDNLPKFFFPRKDVDLRDKAESSTGSFVCSLFCTAKPNIIILERLYTME